jgi:hypothetical protein
MNLQILREETLGSTDRGLAGSDGTGIEKRFGSTHLRKKNKH